MGPAWLWPGQPRIAGLLDELGLPVFEQFAEGRLVFQDGQGAIRRDIEMAPMAGSLRVAGGLGALTDALVKDLPEDMIRLSSGATALTQGPGGITASLTSSTGPVHITARQVVLALPPRVIDAGISFDPELPPSAIAAMRAVPTWMAGHAKVIAIYRTPFWRSMGLSGDAISHIGPLAEIHDASPTDGGAGALFGFVGTPARRNQDALMQAARAQLADLFGEEAKAPLDMMLTDWAFDPMTATAADHTPPAGHPRYGTPPALADLWGGCLHLASTEMASAFGGFLEGALEAAETVFDRLQARPT